jgi:redox-regulated HSP33 family molecular chaperone
MYNEEQLEKLSQLIKLINELEGKSKATTEQLNLLFNLNNYFTSTPEYGKHCSSCVQRTYKRMKNFMMSISEDNKKIIEEKYGKIIKN